MTHTANRPVRSVGLVLTLLVVCVGGLIVSAGAAAGQTADFDPDKPYVGMEVTASDSQIQDGEFYDLRVVDSFDGGTVSTHSFVTELEADGNEIVIETESLEPDANYFVAGPRLDSPTSLTEEQTFELREQTLNVGFGDDDDRTDASTEGNHTDPDTAQFYGTVTLNDDPAPPNTTIEAEINSEVHGSITVDTPGEYGNATEPSERLVVDRPADDEQLNVLFYITPPESDRIAANQSVTWEGGTLTQLNLTADVPTPAEHDDDTDTDDEPDDTTVDTNQTTDDDAATDEESVTDDTTDTAPGFGILLTLVSLAAVVLLGHRRTT